MARISRNKALLEWNEPGISQRYLVKRLSWKLWLKLALPDFVKSFLLTAGLLIIDTLIFHKLNLIEIFALSVLGAIVIIAPNIFLMFKPQVHISLRENDIERFGVDGAAHIAYKDIQRCTLSVYDLAGTTVRALEVLMIDGNTVIFEIAPSISYSDVRSVLHDKEIEVN